MNLNYLKLVTAFILGLFVLLGCDMSITYETANETIDDGSNSIGKSPKELIAEFKLKPTTDNDYLIVLKTENSKSEVVEQAIFTFHLNDAKHEIQNSYEIVELKSLTYVAAYDNLKEFAPKTVNYGLTIKVERDNTTHELHSISVNQEHLANIKQVMIKATDTMPEYTLDEPSFNTLKMESRFDLKSGEELTTFKAGPEYINTLTIYRGGRALI